MVDFDRVNRFALSHRIVIERLLRELVPGGEVRNGEYVVLNPRRNDKRLGLVPNQLRERPVGRFRH